MVPTPGRSVSVNTRFSEPGGLIDARQPGMRDGAAQEGNLQHAWPGDVADEASIAVQEARVFLAPERRADAESRLICRHAASASMGLGRITESASKRLPARRQKTGRMKCSATT